MANLQVGVAGNGTVTVGAGASVHSPASNTLTLGTNGDERVRIDSSGRLLVGHTATTSKDRQIQLVGTSADGSAYMALRHSADANGSRVDLCKSRNATPGSNTIVQDGDVLGSIDFLGDDGTDVNSVGAAIEAKVDGTPGSNDMPGALVLKTTADGAAAATERVRISSAGLVGIGEDTPTRNLHIDGTAHQSGIIIHTAGNHSTAIDMDSNRSSAAGGLAELNFKWNGTAVGQIGAYSGADTTNKDDGHIHFGTASAGSIVERLRIDSSGRLLINQTSNYTVYGDNKFQISATDATAAFSVTRWSNNSSSPYINLGKSRGGIGAYTIVQDDDRLGQINFTGADGTDLASPAAGIAAYVDGTPGSNDMPGRLVFFTASDGGVAETERLRIDSSGRLGLGVTPYASSTVSLSLKDGTNFWSSSVNNSYWGANTYYNGSAWKYIANGIASTIRQENGVFKIHNSSSGSADASVTLNELLRVDGSGRVLVGNSSYRPVPNQNYNNTGDGTTPKLYCEGLGDSTGITIVSNNTNAWRGSCLNLARSRGASIGANTIVADGDSIGQVCFNANDGTDFYTTCAQIRAEIDGTPGSNDTPGRLIFATTADGSGNSSERMRITTNGYALFNKTTHSITTVGTSIMNNGELWVTAATASALSLNRQDNDGQTVRFHRGGSHCGNISVTSSSTAYNTSSDYRLKENQVAISDGITRLKQLKPYRFNFKIDPDKTVDGFFAHEVTPVVAEAIFGEKDAVETADDDVKEIKKGDPIYQQIDQAKLVPLLTAALQEAITEIETLKTKVAALESA